jgi:sensor histidine kinase regulating citrate/malate metabolism
VPAELRERVFEMGFSTKPAGAEGRGVGLALVRDIVTAAGGSIRIDDADASRFVLVLRGRG